MSIATRTLNSVVKPVAALVVCLGLAAQLAPTSAKAGTKEAFFIGAGIVTAIAINEAIKHNNRPGPQPYTGPRRRNPAPARVRTTVRRQQYNRAEAMRIQVALNTLGYDAGVVDGIIGSGTQAAIRTFQIEVDDDPTGYLTATQKVVLYDRAERIEDTNNVSDAGTGDDDVDYVAELEDEDYEDEDDFEDEDDDV